MQMRTALIILGLAGLLRAEGQRVTRITDPAGWVNPLMGTDSKYSLSNGNTYPAIELPWGMNAWMPQTGKMGDGWSYQYGADKIRGFRQTHQPSPWINDYGQFSVMPVTRHLQIDEETRASWFSHKTEVAHPYYYSVYLADQDVTAEFTPTERSVQFRFTFPQTDSAMIVVDAFDKGSYVRIIPGERKIIGYTTKNSGGVPDNFKNYFVLYFDKPLTIARAWQGRGNLLGGDSLEYRGDHAGAVIGFATAKGEQVHMRTASSFISLAQAELNLRREIGSDDFGTTCRKAHEAWNQALGIALAEGGTVDQTRTFYSCLYRTLLFPRKFYELDAGDHIVHYSPYNGQVLAGYMFTDNGFWDTFRAVFPLMTLLFPELNGHMMEGLANAYKESGWLPEWASPGHRDCMVGSHSASLIADSWLKGIRGYDIQTLYEAILKNSEHEGPLSSVGRRGVSYYNSLGYIPYDVKINENVARTLDYAYDDFTIRQLARALHRPAEELARFSKRCLNYRNVFDPETRLMRGRNADGTFQSPFSPFKWGDAFTEGNSWQWTWCVFHDIKGLMGLMGGKETFLKMMDSVFKLPPTFDASYYGVVIHEIREMQIMNMGQYAHGNQPIQHMLYLYDYAGQPWKTQYWVRQVMDKLYDARPDGYCGDEDNGQTSAWYVFSAMGFYSVCPGTQQYAFGAPLFRKMTLTMEGGKKFVISAPANSDRNLYIQRADLNGQVYDKNWISHFVLRKGGALNLLMGPGPAKGRGVSPEDEPYSLSDERPAR
ncbi:MAG: GH92 family glycosyl hydrolase [Bacteroidota bacterium]|nr:GH92 family glycosyl hydrolase [Bacteroidota bacterium]MDP4248057.1 GH92 family glycosyl hydrolase [Bacteroidota bacterium]MDP4258570.1 GH92 family glycosyl hydrolase [Bacteroidota bacterium]